MALASTVHAPLSTPPYRVALMRLATDPAMLWPAFLTLLVGTPWLGGGYIFGTDWPGPRRFDFPSNLSSSAPLEAALSALSVAISAQLAAKVLIFGFLFAGSYLAYRALPVGDFIPRASASALFVVNPFVYSRMHYGQLYLLAGYCALPWVLIRLDHLLHRPSLLNGTLMALSVALVGVFTPHLTLVAGILATVMAAFFTVAAEQRVAYLKSLAPSALAAAAVAFVLSAYWVIPLLLARGVEGSRIASFGPGDLIAFAAVPDERLGLVPNLLGLYGFWAEDTARFTSLKAFVPYWPLAMAGILVVSGVGVRWAFSRQPRRAVAPWVTGLLVAGAIALILEMGVSHPATAGITRWLDAHFTFYRGMRDAGKWAALLALVYSQLFGLGAAAILERVRNLKLKPAAIEWVGATAAGLLLALPLYYGNGLLFGFHGGIRPSQYPAGWYAADRALGEDPHPGRTLFLPWHLYLSFPFIENQNEVVACPAPTFFSVPILYSRDPGVFGVPPPEDRDQEAVAVLVKAGEHGQWARTLSGLGVKYILLAKTVDWATYKFLDTQTGIARVADYGSIVLYKDTG